jgi:hypothetical protein
MTTDETSTPMPITDPALIPHPRHHRDDSHDGALLARYADLLAAARAAVAASEDGESDPLWYVRDELDAQDPAVDRDDW